MIQCVSSIGAWYLVFGVSREARALQLELALPRRHAARE
jgi:hypothetical protein